jgi:hypothetical protein
MPATNQRFRTQEGLLTYRKLEKPAIEARRLWDGAVQDDARWLVRLSPDKRLRTG